MTDTSYTGYSNGDLRSAANERHHVGGQCANGLKMIILIGDEPTTIKPPGA